jgi:Erythromycin esterase
VHVGVPEVVALLAQLRHAGDSPRTTAGALDEQFIAAHNAEAAVGAERYYRAMVRGGTESWNVRDCHMADTLDRLLRRYGPQSKAVVWEHNTHTVTPEPPIWPPPVWSTSVSWPGNVTPPRCNPCTPSSNQTPNWRPTRPATEPTTDRCQRNHSGMAQSLDHGAQAQVVGPETMCSARRCVELTATASGARVSADLPAPSRQYDQHIMNWVTTGVHNGVAGVGNIVGCGVVGEGWRRFMAACQSAARQRR